MWLQEVSFVSVKIPLSVRQGLVEDSSQTVVCRHYCYRLRYKVGNVYYVDRCASFQLGGPGNSFVCPISPFGPCGRFIADD